MEFKGFSLFHNDTKVKRFANDLSSGKIMGTVCKRCGRSFYPPRADCPECLSSDVHWLELKGEGRLVTYTIINVPPDHFATIFKMPFSKIRFDPCPTGVIQIQNGLRAMGWIPNVNPKDIRVGIVLKAEPQTLPGGRITIYLNPAK